jgi:hypothetical protein
MMPFPAPSRRSWRGQIVIKKRVFAVMMALLGGIPVSIMAASPAFATGTACGAGPKCFTVYGEGNHVHPRVCISTTSGTSSSGHLQVRWHRGTDQFANSNGGVINPNPVCMNLDVTVDANTYVCGRWWHWTGSSWILPYGDWTCVKTHP